MSNGTRVIFFRVRFHRGDERPTRPRSPLITHAKSDRGLVSPPVRRPMKGHGWRRPLENVVSSQLNTKWNTSERRRRGRRWLAKREAAQTWPHTAPPARVYSRGPGARLLCATAQRPSYSERRSHGHRWIHGVRLI